MFWAVVWIVEWINCDIFIQQIYRGCCETLLVCVNGFQNPQLQRFATANFLHWMCRHVCSCRSAACFNCSCLSVGCHFTLENKNCDDGSLFGSDESAFSLRSLIQSRYYIYSVVYFTPYRIVRAAFVHLKLICDFYFAECNPEVVKNVDFSGGDIASLFSPDVKHCQLLCTQHPSCLFFTFLRADWTGDNRYEGERQ